MLGAHDWGFPVPIAYGPGRIAEAGRRCVGLGIDNPLIVTDRGSRNLKFITRLQSILGEAGLKSALFFEISPNPIDTEISAGRAAFREGKHDAIIAIGGGSAMDGGKAICLTANNSIDLWDFEFEKPVPKIVSDNAFPKLITIPTTAGTGAETESTGMVTDSKQAMKFCVWHPELKPSLALLDPELTVGLPANLTAWTGADALVHAIEAYLVPGFNPLCDAMALEALSLISTWLPIVVAEPTNLTARGGMHMGSCLAGISFLKGLGLVHAISHMIGAEFNTHHGLTNAIILPVVLRFNLPGMDEKVQRMAEAMKLPDQSVNGFINSVEVLLDKIAIQKSLGEIGVTVDCAERIAGKALKDSAARTNPRIATLAEVQAITETAITKAR
jgi:alcohol dehydrogenase class IV